MFGRLPVRTRSYVRSFTLIPNLNDGVGSLWYYPGDIEVHGSATNLHTLTHETAHGLDFLALAPRGSPPPYSNTSPWRAAYAADNASVSDYARASWQEDFAEVGILGLYDRVVPGGVGKLVQQQVSEVANLSANHCDALPGFSGSVEGLEHGLRILHELPQAHD